MLDFLKNALDNAKKMVDQKMNQSVAEGAMAVAASVAAADGKIDDSELDAVHEIITNEDTLKNQDTDVLCELFDKYAKSMGSPLKRRSVQKAIDGLKSRSDEEKEFAFLVGYEIAAADGNVDDDEKATLQKVATNIGVNYNKLMNS
jgi:tellurite resistance protein